jgi:hypothetical protein
VSNHIEETYQRLWPSLAPLSPRKQLLAAVGFIRRFESLFTDEMCHQLLDVAERVADEELELGALVAHKNRCFKRLQEKPAELPYRSADYIACELGFYASYRFAELSGRRRPDRPRTAAGELLANVLMWHPFVRLALPNPGDSWSQAEEQAFRDVCRDAGGVPGFRLDPRWVSDNAARISTVMYESRDFAPMPVLADALEDAGCADPDVLAHCRGPGPHIRGCWVVDLVLGKA